MDHAVFDLGKFRPMAPAPVGDAWALVQTQRRSAEISQVHINPRPEHVGADIVDAQNRFRLQRHPAHGLHRPLSSRDFIHHPVHCVPKNPAAFTIKMQITRLATGSNTAIPILAPAISTQGAHGEGVRAMMPGVRHQRLGIDLPWLQPGHTQYIHSFTTMDTTAAINASRPGTARPPALWTTTVFTASMPPSPGGKQHRGQAGRRPHSIRSWP